MIKFLIVSCEPPDIPGYKTILKSIKYLSVLKQGFHSQNFCAIFAERNENFFFLCASVFREKKQQFEQSFAKVISRKIALFRVLRNSSFAQFRNKSFAQFRNFVKIKRLVTVCFLEFNSGKILFWNVFLLVTFT